MQFLSRHQDFNLHLPGLTWLLTEFTCTFGGGGCVLSLSPRVMYECWFTRENLGLHIHPGSSVPVQQMLRLLLGWAARTGCLPKPANLITPELRGVGLSRPSPYSG